MAELKWNGSAAKKAAHQAGMKALYKCAEAILAEAIDEVPLESGTLERSGAITESGNSAYISFNTPYARKQHEDLTLRHVEGRKAKYLEDPFNRKKEKVRKYILRKVKEALQRGR